MPRVLAEGRAELVPVRCGLAGDVGAGLGSLAMPTMADAPRIKRLRADLGEALRDVADRL